jgi:hypothetical protein
MDPELLTRWQALDTQFYTELDRLRQLEEEAELLLHFHRNFRRTCFSSTDQTYYPPIVHSPTLPSPFPSPKSPPYRPLSPFQNGASQSHQLPSPPLPSRPLPRPTPRTPDPRPPTPPSILRRHTSPTTRPSRGSPLLRNSPGPYQVPPKTTTPRAPRLDQSHRPQEAPVPLPRQPLDSYSYIYTDHPRTLPLVLYRGYYWNYYYGAFLPYHPSPQHTAPRYQFVPFQ